MDCTFRKMSKSDLFFCFFVGVDVGFFDQFLLGSVFASKNSSQRSFETKHRDFRWWLHQDEYKFFFKCWIKFTLRLDSSFFSAKISFFVEWFFATFWFFVVKGSLFFFYCFLGQKLIGLFGFYHSFWIWYFYMYYFFNKKISFARFSTSFADFLFFLAKTDCEVKNERAWVIWFLISVFKTKKSH